MQEFLAKGLKYLLGMDMNEIVQSRAARDVAGSLALRIVNRLLQIALAIILARIMPLKEFGLYALVMSWVMVLSVPALVGTLQFAQREIAVAKSGEQWGRLKGIFRWSTYIVLSGSFLVSVISICWIFAAMPSLNQDRVAFVIGFIFIPAIVLAQLWQAQLRGWGAILAGQIPDTIIRPALFAAFLMVMVTLVPSGGVNATSALLIQGVVVLVTLVVAAALKFHYVEIPKHTRPETEPWTWLRLSSRFTFLGGLAILNNQIGILMVGAMSGKSEAGLFAVAVRGAGLLVVGLMAANLALSPRMAAFYHGRKLVRLRQMIARTYRVVVLITIPVVLLFVFFGNFFLSIFGKAYVAAWPALIILSIGQFLNVFSGPVGTMLNMAGQEKVTMAGVAASLMVTSVANLILIPLLGINGAALGTALGMITWNLLLVIICYRRLGIWTPVLGFSFCNGFSNEH